MMVAQIKNRVTGGFYFLPAHLYLPLTRKSHAYRVRLHISFHRWRESLRVWE